MTARIPKHPRARAFVSLFILYNILAITVSTSRPVKEQNAFEKFFLPYAVWTRLLQSWALFTPSPRTYTLNYRVEITFKDGTHTTWRRPYPPNWDFFERHLSYNFQKYDLASNYLERRGVLWEDLALYIQHLYWNEQNPPETIQLIRALAPLPPPNISGYVMHDESELQYHDHLMFTYHVAEKRME